MTGPRFVAGAVLAVLLLAACPSEDRYPDCAAARSASAAPLHRGDPGWNSDLDRDGDGVACE